MKHFARSFPVVTILALVSLTLAPAGRRPPSANDPPSRSPVVVELFTSEGCSSCPPADALLAALEEQQPVPGAEIIALEEHVDYWNHQGWNDPFSSWQWTERQQAYADSRKTGSVYTPQIIVNGRTEFVGNRGQQARYTIAGALSQLQTEISLSALPPAKPDHLRFSVSVGKLAGAAPSDAPEVWLAVTEKGLHSAVAAGENAGHELHHASVVRQLRKLGAANKDADPAFTAQPDLKLDSAWKHSNLRVVAFVQEKHSRHILAAAASPL